VLLKPCGYIYSGHNAFSLLSSDVFLRKKKVHPPACEAHSKVFSVVVMLSYATTLRGIYQIKRKKEGYHLEL